MDRNRDRAAKKQRIGFVELLFPGVVENITVVHDRLRQLQQQANDTVNHTFLEPYECVVGHPHTAVRQVFLKEPLFKELPKSADTMVKRVAKVPPSSISSSV